MRKLAVAFVLMLLTTWPDPAYSGELFKSDNLKFQIVFPAKPMQQSKTQTFASGNAQVIRFKSTDKQLRPAITVTVFSRGAFTPAEAATGLELSGQRQVAHFNGKIVSRTDLEVGGIAGKETVIKGTSQGRTFFYRAQTFYAGNRQYVLSVAAATLDGVTVSADSYFASFKLWE